MPETFTVVGLIESLSVLSASGDKMDGLTFYVIRETVDRESIPHVWLSSPCSAESFPVSIEPKADSAPSRAPALHRASVSHSDPAAPSTATLGLFSNVLTTERDGCIDPIEPPQPPGSSTSSTLSTEWEEPEMAWSEHEDESIVDPTQAVPDMDRLRITVPSIDHHESLDASVLE